ncbi:MAG: Xaa-Pro peptidase family protein [Gemmatimonadales bacterium]
MGFRFRLATVTALALASLAPEARAQISKDEYATRRAALAEKVADGLVVAFGGVTPISDFGPFHQLAAFRYLTGYEFADAVFVMAVKGGRGRGVLFVNETETRRSLYYGQEPDSVAVEASLGLPSLPIGRLRATVDSLLRAGAAPIWEVRDFAAADFAAQDSLTRGGQFVRALAAAHPGLQVKNAHPILNRLRATKSEAELALIRKAAEITSEGHAEAMRQLVTGMHEYDVQAIVESSFRRQGAERPAYGSIVGSGPLSLQLHYMKDRRAMQPGEVVVIDAGAEYDGYAADVTRTLPVDGVYTREQRQIYQLVRDAQAAAERNSRAGKSFRGALDSSVAVRAEGLAKLGLIESPGATFDPPWRVDCARRRNSVSR